MAYAPSDGPAYAKINRKIWNTAQFRAVSPEARQLFLYIISCPHGNILGLFILRPGYVMDDLQLTSKKQFMEPLQELLREGLIKYDPKTEMILDIEHLEKNPLDNQNQVKAAIRKLEELPKSVLFQDLKLLLERFKEQFKKGFLQPLIERLGERLGEPFKEPVTVTGSVTVTDNPPLPPLPENGNGFILPEWVPKDEWNGFVKMRSKIRKPLTDDAKKLTVRELERLKQAGHEPRDVLNQSIQRSWQGVFELKSSTGREAEKPWYEQTSKQ